MDMPSESENESLVPPKKASYTFTVGKHLHKKMENHIRAVKFLDSNYSKQHWIADAIQEKLESERIQGPEEFTREHVVNMKIDKRLDQLVEKQVGIYRKFRKSYSKKLWLVEAISEKLDKEEAAIKKQVETLITSV